jgi:arylesterase / paraoxonase
MKKLGIIVLIILVVVGLWVVDLLMDAGQFKTIEPHFAGKCTQISGIVGPEDITIHPKTNVAYISAIDIRAALIDENTNGSIYRYDLKESKPALIKMSHDHTGGLFPHGISLYPDKNGAGSLFVVNHARGQHTIEIFSLVDGRLEHQKTLSSPMIISPNDVVAVGPDRFYFTNDHNYRNGFMRTLEDYGRLKVANLVYYDGETFSEVAADFAYPNGVNVSRDGQKLFMIAGTEQVLYVFDRNIDSGSLEEVDKVELGTVGDNIEMAANGDIWIAAHPQILKFVAHAADASKLSPSQVLRVFEKPDRKYQLEEIYLNDGKELSGSSVAAPYGKRFLIGAVFDSKFLDCTLE